MSFQNGISDSTSEIQRIRYHSFKNIETLETLNIEVSDYSSKILQGKSKCFHPVMIGDRLNRTFEK